jgi:ABC-2 type transport system permease protein
MRKTWLVAYSTYRRRVRSGSFLFLTFGLPLLMIVAGALPLLLQRSTEIPPRVGYVDQTNQLTPVSEVTTGQITVKLVSFPDTQAARSAFDQGEIGGYLVIPQAYFSGVRPTYFGKNEPGSQLETALIQFMQRAMLGPVSADALARLENPAEITYVATDRGIAVAEGPDLILRFAIPAGLAILFALALLFTSAQMGAAVVREKEQRAMELVVTSLRPSQLVAGKVIGMTLLSMTQFAIWGAGALIAIALAVSGRFRFELSLVPWNAVIWAVVLGIPAYFLYAVLASGLGILAGSSQQAQQLAGLLGFLGMAPLWFTAAIVEAPDGALAVGLSIFPLTAPVFGLLRMALSAVPTWQLLAGLASIVVSLVTSIWIVGRVFRVAMLTYGKPVGLQQIREALRE